MKLHLPHLNTDIKIGVRHITREHKLGVSSSYITDKGEHVDSLLH